MSIKANELRIGVLVDIINRSNAVHLPTGLIFRVIAIGIFDVMLLPNETPTHEATSDIILTVPIGDLCGIKLAEDWLIKFGFEDAGKSSKERKAFHKEFMPNKILEIWDDDYSVRLWNGHNGWRMTFSHLWTNLKYVHQLQNLYFALTGEELTLSNK